ncbi:MAG: M48 family metallopeptidase [Gammaproteobacteria bacterium]|nr:M48 family metallopeptidase [Gammaproteobacteria bacterium]
MGLSHFRLDNAIRFLRKHEKWVHKQTAIWQPMTMEATLPTHIHLAAMSERLPIHYETHSTNKQARSELLQRPDNSLVYVGYHDKKAICRVLRKWCIMQAKRFLTAQLAQLSQITQLTYQSVTFRSQKTRWGSCNHEGTISLNTQLIFLPLDIVDYVLIHELAHTQHPNHSTDFWSLVAKHQPDYLLRKKRLRVHEKTLPAWFLQSGR